MIESALTPSAIRKKQIRLALVILCSLFLLIGIGLAFISPSKSQQLTQTRSTPSLNAIQHEPVDASTLWLERAENNVQELQKTTQALTEKLTHSEEQQANQLAQSQNQSQQIENLQQRLQQLDEQMQNQAKLSQPPSALPVQPAGIADDGSPLPVLPLPKQANSVPEIPKLLIPPTAIKHDTLALKPVANHLKLHGRLDDKTIDNTIKSTHHKNADNYIPAGSFATAVLLSGLDASAGVTSQTQPRPVLLRITGFATLPHQQRSNLKDCLVTGAGYGDISSERAYIRLERLSCHRQGQITDFPVYGYVTGQDGKAGIRGKPVWREGNLLQRSFLSGLFSGLGQSITNQATLASGSTGMPSGEILKQGLAGGTSTSLGKLADYHIQRAEQYQPVIQVSAGAKVDIVFHTGFYLDGHAETETESPIISPTLQSPIATNESPIPTSNSEPQETNDDAI